MAWNESLKRKISKDNQGWNFFVSRNGTYLSRKLVYFTPGEFSMNDCILLLNLIWYNFVDSWLGMDSESSIVYTKGKLCFRCPRCPFLCYCWWMIVFQYCKNHLDNLWCHWSRYRGIFYFVKIIFLWDCQATSTSSYLLAVYRHRKWRLKARAIRGIARSAWHEIGCWARAKILSWAGPSPKHCFHIPSFHFQLFPWVLPYLVIPPVTF